VGQRCPVGGQGPLDELPPGSAMRIDGPALLSAIRDEWQKLRCAACGHMVTASLPTEGGEDKDRPRARAVLAIGRYALGLPLYRLQSSQAMLGGPVADATQWDQSEQGGDWSDVVLASLETLAAQGELISQADTSVRLLTRLKENQERQARAEAMGFSRSKERTGRFTTALVVKVGERLRCLDDSGRAHAGANLAARLEQREAAHGKPWGMSDALSRNEVEETTVIRCHCLAHGRRQFRDLEDVLPGECRVVLDVLKHVCDHEEQAREERMSSQARVVDHRPDRGPLMEGLKQW
jgi:transposase